MAIKRSSPKFKACQSGRLEFERAVIACSVFPATESRCRGFHGFGFRPPGARTPDAELPDINPGSRDCVLILSGGQQRQVVSTGLISPPIRAICIIHCQSGLFYAQCLWI